MKAVIAYALLVIGLPILAGQLFGAIINLPIAVVLGWSRRGKETPSDAAEAAANEPIAWMFGGGAKMGKRDVIAHASLDVFSGFGAILAAALLFHLFGLAPNVAVLLIVSGWEAFFTIRYGQSRGTLFASLAGIIVGWLVVLRLLRV
jgi:hypothetical protein